MNCSEIQDLLSAYFDDELSPEVRLSVSEHLKVCPRCTKGIRGFEELSALAETLAVPVPAETGWHQLEELLDQEPVADARQARRFWRLPGRRILAVAATILLAIGIGVPAYRMWSPHHKQAAIIGQYVEEFQRDPVMAQKMLLAAYDGQAVDAEQAIQRVGYRPAVADGLPEGYTIESTYVVQMPCCTCVQTLCKRRDGSVLVVFEHDDEAMNWFGGRPGIKANCGGTECSVVQLNSQLAASWKRGKRHMTLVGIRDMGEANELIASLGGEKQAGKSL